MNSSMIATEPIPQDIWETIGWEGRETLGDTAHGFFYAQRTVDGRIAIGGRSVPYRFGSRTDIDGQVPEHTIAHLTAVLHSVLFWALNALLTPFILLASLVLDRKRTVHDWLLGTVVARTDR